MYTIKKLKLYFIVLAFIAPLLFFTAKGFGSDSDSRVWKSEQKGPYLPIERTEGWQTKMHILSRH